MPINDVSLCCHREESTGEINNILIVKLFRDPNDPTKAIFIKLASSQDRGTMESILQENKFEFDYNSILRLCNEMAQIEDREKIIEKERKELIEQVKSISEMISESKERGPYQPNMNKVTLNKIDYENEDFINTFNGLNTSCVKTSDTEFNKKKFKYSDIFKIKSEYNA